MVGDFNQVLELSKYYFNYVRINNPKARQVVIEQMNTVSHIVLDIYRELYPKVKRYPCGKPDLLKQGCLEVYTSL